MNIKALLSITAIATLTACGSGEFVAPAEGVSCSAIDLSKVPAGYCADPSDVIHAGKPNSPARVVSDRADVATKE